MTRGLTVLYEPVGFKKGGSFPSLQERRINSLINDLRSMFSIS